MEQTLLKEKNKIKSSEPIIMASPPLSIKKAKRSAEAVTTADNAVTAQKEQLLALLCLKKKVCVCMLVCLLRS